MKKNKRNYLDFGCDQTEPGTKHSVLSISLIFFPSNCIEPNQNLCVIITHIVFSVLFHSSQFSFVCFFFFFEFFHSLSMRSSLTFNNNLNLFLLFMTELALCLSLSFFVTITTRNDDDVDNDFFTWFYGNVSLNIHTINFIKVVFVAACVKFYYFFKILFSLQLQTFISFSI